MLSTPVSTEPKMQIPPLVEGFSRFLGEHLLSPCLLQHHEAIFQVSSAGFHEALGYLKTISPQPASYVSAFAVDSRHLQKGFQVRSVFYLKTHHLFVTLVLNLNDQKPQYPAISCVFSAANWHERELHDLFGIEPLGIDLPPLVLHRDWQRGKNFPMRKDFTAVVEPKEVPHHFNFSEHSGSHQVAVGPIHAGIIEPGHLRFSVTGEFIHQFDAQLFYTHKGIEKMAEGKPYAEGLTLAEHVCGLCAFSHSTAFCQTMEALLGMVLPNNVLTIRAILLELERLGSHLGDLTAICSSGGFGFASVRAAYFREQILQINQQLVGHRFLRGFNQVGGVQKAISADVLKSVATKLTQLTVEYEAWVVLALSTESFLDRVDDTGILTNPQARQLGVVGIAAKGSGIADDMRFDFPYEVHSKLRITVRIHTACDAFARFKVRIEEVTDSLALVATLLNQLSETGVSVVSVAPTKALTANETGLSVVESAKGSLLHWVQLGENGTLSRWHVRSASYMNWRGVVHATMGNNIVPDGPLVNKSFNLCYACCDR